MNAGANGVETRERVVEVRALDRKGELHILSMLTWATPIGTHRLHQI